MGIINIGKKKEDLPPLEAGPSPLQQQEVPLPMVMELRGKGLSDAQIIQKLQQDGYRVDQIYDALNQSDIKGGVEGAALPQQPPSSMPPPPRQPAPPKRQEPIAPFSDTERVEEIAEAIIDEKWKELTKDLDKILEWKDKAESRLTLIEQNIENLKQGFEKLHSSILGKVSEYDQNIINLGTEIKAMEKVFQKLIPAFTENVNELSRITQTLKRGVPKEKQ